LNLNLGFALRYSSGQSVVTHCPSAPLLPVAHNPNNPNPKSAPQTLLPMGSYTMLAQSKAVTNNSPGPGCTPPGPPCLAGPARLTAQSSRGGRG
jgi:hypothetical protein